MSIIDSKIYINLGDQSVENFINLGKFSEFCKKNRLNFSVNTNGNIDIEMPVNDFKDLIHIHDMASPNIGFSLHQIMLGMI